MTAGAKGLAIWDADGDRHLQLDLGFAFRTLPRKRAFG